jgi:hypothetical protein
VGAGNRVAATGLELYGAVGGQVSHLAAWRLYRFRMQHMCFEVRLVPVGEFEA